MSLWGSVLTACNITPASKDSYKDAFQAPDKLNFLQTLIASELSCPIESDMDKHDTMMECEGGPTPFVEGRLEGAA